MKLIVTSALMALVYVMTVGSAKPLDWLVGFAFGLIAAARFGRITREPWTLGRMIGLPRFALGVVAQVAGGSWKMFLVLVGKRTWTRMGWVEVALDRPSRRGLEVSGLVTTASPGSLVVELDDRTHRMMVHVIDASHPEEVAQDLQRFYERHQRASLP